MAQENQADDAHDADEEALAAVEDMPEGYGRAERDAELQALENDPALQVEVSEEWAGADDLDEAGS